MKIKKLTFLRSYFTAADAQAAADKIVWADGEKPFVIAVPVETVAAGEVHGFSPDGPWVYVLTSMRQLEEVTK